jgi:hypothetical protein
MADTQNDASEAARAMLRQRWGNAVVVRSAQVVIERVDELPEALREQLHQATGEVPAGGA